MSYIFSILVLLISGISGALYGVSVNASEESLYRTHEPVVTEVSTSDTTDTSPAPKGVAIATESTPVPEVEIEPIEIIEAAAVEEKNEVTLSTSDSFEVPFYSQFTDITDPSWKKIGCGIASVAMLIDYYADAVPVDTLLQEGIAAGAYLNNAGWTHAGLIGVSKKYGLDGSSYDMAGLSMDAAFSKLKSVVSEGPVMVSIYYTFTPGHPIPHLVVINGIEGNTVHYNDPAEPSGGGTISIENFKPAWKKRYIEIRPVT